MEGKKLIAMSAENQLNNYAKQQGMVAPGIITNANGASVGIKTASLTVGKRGPILSQDENYLDEMSHFDRERIPERVKHAKGSGAFGYFEVTHDITQYSAAKVFDKIGKRTPVSARFSTVGGEMGSADTVRDPRGFSIKFNTDDGIWDVVGLSFPIFFIRDPTLFPSFIHSQKRNPQTHLRDANMFWDFITLRPETTHQMMFLFSDRGIPDGYRFMNGFGTHAFKLINAKDEAVYCKFHFKAAQGIKNLDVHRAQELAGKDPDYATRDLFNAIGSGKYPSWDMCIQVMTFKEAEKFKFNPFDVTKIWPQKDYPLIPVGRLTLDKNPNNYFAEIEQIAFAPSHLVPGIEPSPDKMLQGRLFSYTDSQRHRLGANYMQIPVNCPYRVSVRNFQRDGPMTVTDNQGGAPNYYPNSFSGPQQSLRATLLQPPFKVSGDVYRYDSGNEDNFSQATEFWDEVLDEGARKRLVQNIANHLMDADEFIQERAVANFTQVKREFGQMLMIALKSERTHM